MLRCRLLTASRSSEREVEDGDVDGWSRASAERFLGDDFAGVDSAPIEGRYDRSNRSEVVLDEFGVVAWFDSGGKRVSLACCQFNRPSRPNWGCRFFVWRLSIVSVLLV